jgi:pectate lyase
MKKIILLSIFLWSFHNASAQNYYMATPEGFGAAATGGGTPTASNTVTVSTYADLKAALTSTASNTAVILVSGTIDCVYTTVLLTNKTIIGLPGAKLRNTQITLTTTPPSKADSVTSAANSGTLNIKPGSNNVIIRNLIFEGPGAFDCDGRDNLTNEATNIWVDHCEFQDAMDGNFDIKGKAADNVTVSWCKFTYLKAPIADGSGGADDHRFSGVVGSAPDDYPVDGNYSVTFKNCYWAEGCRERMPRVRNGIIHILNCYYNTSATFSKALCLGGGNKNTTCYVENSDFAKISKIYAPYPDDGGTVGLKFDGCMKGIPSTVVTGADVGTAPAKPSYTYTVLPVAYVATYVTNTSCGAGATLQVTAAGVLSTACPNLGIEDYVLTGVKIYPTVVVDTTLNIELSEVVSGDATIAIYSVAGAKVYSSSKNNVRSNDKLSVNVASLSKGVYMCKLQIGESATTLKFIKE